MAIRWKGKLIGFIIITILGYIFYFYFNLFSFYYFNNYYRDYLNISSNSFNFNKGNGDIDDGIIIEISNITKNTILNSNDKRKDKGKGFIDMNNSNQSKEKNKIWNSKNKENQNEKSENNNSNIKNQNYYRHKGWPPIKSNPLFKSYSHLNGDCNLLSLPLPFTISSIIERVYSNISRPIKSNQVEMLLNPFDGHPSNHNIAKITINSTGITIDRSIANWGFFMEEMKGEHYLALLQNTISRLNFHLNDSNNSILLALVSR